MTDQKLAQIIWDYMRYEQPLEKADVIFGLGSADMQTAEWCAELWNDGWAPTILFSGARGRITRDVFTESEADVYAERAEKLGVSSDAILRETRATNTGENISFGYEKLIRSGIEPQKIILVTKPYMLRRAYATFMQQWCGVEKPKIICSGVAISFDEYCRDEGHSFEYVTDIMVGDLQRIREYPKLGFQIPQEIPNEVWRAYEELVRRGYTKHLLS